MNKLLCATSAPVICDDCMEQLKRFQEFVSMCTNTEELVHKISKEEVVPGQLLDLFELLYPEFPLQSKEEVYIERQSPIHYSESATMQSLFDSCEYSQEKKTFKCCCCEYQTKEKKCIKSHLFKHLNKSLVPLYKCEKKNCSWTTRCSSKIKKHVKSHSKEIICSACGTKCYGNFEYRRHFISNHKEGEVWKCPKCEYISDSRLLFFRHTTVHTENYVQCSKCPFRTKYKQSLVSHNSIIHENGPKRPRKEVAEAYYCYECSFKTKTKFCIRNHVLTHKTKSEMPLFECDECDYTGKIKLSLNKHKKTHLNIMYTCSVCDTSFSSRSGFDKHKRIHSGKKKLKCPECDYENMDKYRLDTHLQKHQKVNKGKVYKCRLCSFQSNWKNCVSRHTNTVHKKKQAKEN